MIGKYKIITLCGSTKFKDEFLKAQKQLTLEGNIVISVGFFEHADSEFENIITPKIKTMFDDMHKRKIDMSDEVYVINKNGYIGESTKSEIEYAIDIGKTVNYLENPNVGNDMATLKLILPTGKYKDEIMNYKKEFIKNNDSMDGTGGLRNAKSFEEWYSAILDNLNEETVREGLVPATTYIAISTDDERLIGMIDIRHRLNDYLLNYGGHIGYSVRKSERKKGYATEMLKLALIECRRLGITKVLLTCHKDNTASAKTIIKNGASFENEVQEEVGITQRYWINLN